MNKVSDTAPPEAVFHIHGVSKVYRMGEVEVHALRSVDLDIYSGEFVVLLLPPAEAMRPEPPARFRAGMIERIGLRRFFSPASRMIVRNLERRPLKAALSVLGIALAVAILVVGRYFFDALDYIVEVQFRTIQREDVTVTVTVSGYVHLSAAGCCE